MTRTPTDPARAAALELLRVVRVDDAYANLVLPGILAQFRLTGRDAAFATELGYGTLRWQGWYDRILAAFAAAGVTPRIAEEIWPRANGVGLVRAGLGVTFMTPSEAQHLPPEVAFRALQGPAPESRLVLGWSAETEPVPALAAFLAVATATHPPRKA